jgi:hypothetical protein
MPDFIPATGRTLHVVGVCVNRIGIVEMINFFIKNNRKATKSREHEPDQKCYFKL